MSLERDDWIAEACAVPIESVLERRGVRLRGMGAERTGPCPVCGGGPRRFSVNVRKGLYLCRHAGGGDVIALVRYLDGCAFDVACEILTGRPAPGRVSGETAEARAAREALLTKRAAARARKTEADEAEAERFRQRERRRCWEMWSAARPVAGSAAEAYLTLRGLAMPPLAALRCAFDHPLFADGGGKAEIVHRGPALLAAIVGPDGRFAGLHATWIDLAAPKGKALIADPTTGELVPAKKVRGSARCGHIPLVPCDPLTGELLAARKARAAPGGDAAGPADFATGLIVGEGTETTLSVWRALVARGWPLLAETALWSAYSLGNIGGPALGSIDHPTLRLTDARGRERARRVESDVPDLLRPGLPIPASVKRVWLLRDGDSDPVITRAALKRGARRFLAGRPDLEVREVPAPEGQDFNDMLLEAAA